MIHEISSFLNNKEIEYYKGLFETEPIISKVYDNRYRFELVDIFYLRIPKFDKFNITSLRVQRVNENIEQIKRFHVHDSPYTFVIFLNDDFIDGNLIIKNKIIKPELGKLIIFRGSEPHKVEPCKNNRYTIVGFCDNNPYSKNKKTII